MSGSRRRSARIYSLILSCKSNRSQNSAKAHSYPHQTAGTSSTVRTQARADTCSGSASRPEPFNDDGTWRETQFYQVLGTSYIPTALHAARAADPHAKLYINEYNITFPGPKAASMKRLVAALKRAGVPLDGVGVQAHETVGQVAGADVVRQNLEEFTSLGVEVAITELDVKFPALPSDAAGLEQQRRDYEAIVAGCAAVERCVGVTVWDFTDKVRARAALCRGVVLNVGRARQYSWIPGTFPGAGDACPWDDVSLPGFCCTRRC